MIKLQWFDTTTQNKYAKRIASKIKTDLENEISKFPPDIATLFTEKGLVSEDKIKDFLKLEFTDVDKSPVLRSYIARCDMISKIIDNITPSKYKNSGKSLADFLDGEFAAYNLKYSNYPLKYPSGLKPDNHFKTKLTEALLQSPYNKVFNYSKYEKFFRNDIMSSLNISVCPYCNRQYITSWDDVKNIKSTNKRRKSTADLDHFYPKSEYSLFALSLFNFVPSCQVCNSRMKLSSFLDDSGNRPLYPYNESFDDSAVFIASTITPQNDPKKLLEVWLGENVNDLKVKLEIHNSMSDPKKKDRIKRSNELFHIEDIYQAHKGIVSELMLKRRIYDDGEYLNGLKNIFEGFEPDTFFKNSDDAMYKIIGTDLSITQKQLELFLYGYNWEEGQDSTRPLSKLTYDILKR